MSVFNRHGSPQTRRGALCMFRVFYLSGGLSPAAVWSPGRAHCHLLQPVVQGTSGEPPCDQHPLDHASVQELSALWERVLGALEGGRAPDLACAALAFAYTWYNFMPLARGTAAAGYVAILGLFAAAGAPVSAPCPKARRACWVSEFQVIRVLGFRVSAFCLEFEGVRRRLRRHPGPLRRCRRARLRALPQGAPGWLSQETCLQRRFRATWWTR